MVLFYNQLIIILKRETIEVVLDATHLNSNHDKSFESCPIELLVPQFARANKKLETAIDIMDAYAPASLDKVTNTLT